MARAAAFGGQGTAVWWTGWFGGLTLPTYSAVTPWLMAVLGAPGTGALAALAAVLSARRLFRGAPRPWPGTSAFGLLAVADLVVGRVTFAVGLAVGLLSLCALAQPPARRWTALAAGGAVLACLASPLAGLFTGLAALAVLMTDRVRRAAAGLMAVGLLACGGGLALLFPGAGVMPTTALDVLPSLAAAAVVAVLCRPPVLRAGAALTAAATVVCLLVPDAVGANVTRLAWVVAAPLVVAFGQLPGRGWELLPRRWPAAVLVAAVVGTAVVPAVDLVNQVRAAGDLSSSPGYYEPLVRRLLLERAADPGSMGQRVEVVDPRTHWSSVYVADRVPLARGWNRQADAALNPLFYEVGALDAGSYTGWLHSLAVGWVAVPDAPLDYASVAEGELVTRGVPALRRTWAGDGWTLYRVQEATPLVEGARLVAVDPAGLTVDVPTAGPVLARMRWMPSLVVRSADDGRVLAACPAPLSDGMVTVRLPAGRWRIAPDVDRGIERMLTGACPPAGSGSG